MKYLFIILFPFILFSQNKIYELDGVYIKYISYNRIKIETYLPEYKHQNKIVELKEIKQPSRIYSRHNINYGFIRCVRVIEPGYYSFKVTTRNSEGKIIFIREKIIKL